MRGFGECRGGRIARRPGTGPPGDARAVVGHLDDGGPLAPAAAKGDSGLRVVGGVVDEIADQPGQLLWVAGHPDGVNGGSDGDRGKVPETGAFGQDQIVDIHIYPESGQ